MLFNIIIIKNFSNQWFWNSTKQRCNTHKKKKMKQRSKTDKQTTTTNLRRERDVAWELEKSLRRHKTQRNFLWLPEFLHKIVRDVPTRFIRNFNLVFFYGKNNRTKIEWEIRFGWLCRRTTKTKIEKEIQRTRARTTILNFWLLFFPFSFLLFVFHLCSSQNSDKLKWNSRIENDNGFIF